MKYPRRIEITAGAAINLIRSVVEDLYTESFLELYGRRENGVVKVFNVYNFATADRTSKDVGYGNWSAKSRLDALEEALAGSYSAADMSARIGQAHTHLHPHHGELNSDDLTFIHHRIDEYKMKDWIEIILHRHSLNKSNLDLGVYYSRDGKRLKLIVSNPQKKINGHKGFQLELDFVGHFVYDTDKWTRSKELFVALDETAKKYFTALSSRS